MTTQLNKIYAIKTIALVAQEIGEDEEWLSEIIDEMEPEDGLIWVYGPDGEGTAAFSINQVIDKPILQMQSSVKIQEDLRSHVRLLTN